MATMKALRPSASPSLRFLKAKIANPPTMTSRPGHTKGVRSNCNRAKNPKAINVNPLVILIQRRRTKVK